MVPWVFIVGGALVLLVMVGFPLVMLIAGMLDTDRAQLLRPMEAHELKPWSKMLAGVQESAEALGFVYLGTYTEGGRGQVGLMISGDGGALLALLQWGISNYALETLLSDQRMVVTRHTGGLEDLSGLEVRRMLASDRFEVVYQYHLAQVAAAGVPHTYFDPDHAAEQIVAHEARRMRRMIDMGYARPRSENTFSFT